MTRTILAAALVAGLAGAAQAQVSTVAPDKVKAGTYAVEPIHTQILFAVSHLGFTTWYGNFSGASGTLTLDPTKPASSAVSISIPVASLSTTSAALDKELVGGAWLNAAADPAITFKSTSVTPTGGDTADIAGDLTLHGFTHPVTLKATFNGAGVNPLDRHYTVGFDATTRIKRSAFGVNKYVPLVGDDVTITISAAFEKK